MTHRFWADMTASDWADLAPRSTAVLPMGATEHQGSHLPLSVDTDLTNEVLARALPLLKPDQNVLVLPSLSIANSDQNARQHGTLCLSPGTLLAVLADTTAALAHAKCQRLLLLCGHSSNTAVLDLATHQACLDHNLVATHTNWLTFAKLDALSLPDPCPCDLRTADVKTSAMLATRPDWTMDELSHTCACGHSTNSSVEKGAKILNSAANGLARHLVSLGANGFG